MARQIEIQELSVQLQNINRAIVKAANNCAFPFMKFVEGKYKERLFSDGLDSKQKKIGKYSEKPMPVGGYPKSFKTKKAANKVFGSKKKRASRNWTKIKGNSLIILEGGYKEFRELHGLQTSKVDLEFTGDLRRSIQIGRLGKSVVLGFTNDKSREIAIGQEERFNKNIFEVSANTIEEAIEVCLEEIEKALLSV